MSPKALLTPLSHTNKPNQVFVVWPLRPPYIHFLFIPYKQVEDTTNHQSHSKLKLGKFLEVVNTTIMFSGNRFPKKRRKAETEMKNKDTENSCDMAPTSENAN